MSPASSVIAGFAVVSPAVRVTEPAARRKPSAVATTVYVPAEAVRLKVPSVFAVTEVTSVFSALYRLTVTGLPACTSPVSVPVVGRGVEVGVADASGVDVNVGVGDTSGVEVCVAVEVGVGDTYGVAVEVSVTVGVGDSSGVEVDVGVDVSVGVGDSSGVGVKVGVAVFSGVSVNVGVGVLKAITVRLAGVEGSALSTPSPLETRATHSIVVWPACKPSTLKLKAAPPVTAFLPLLPAIARMKLPFWGVVAAITGSIPKRSVRVIFPTSTRLALYVQVNSALV